MEWIAKNCLRSFPLRENCPSTSVNTLWPLPTNLLADLFVAAPGASAGVYLSSVCVTARIVSITLALAGGGSIATASAVVGADAPYAGKALNPLSPGVAGSVVFGDILDPDLFGQLMMGNHVFSQSALLESRCACDTGIFPIRSIVTIAGTSAAGDVAINSNSELQVAPSLGTDDGDPLSMLTLSLANPASFLSPCENPSSPCGCASIPIFSINGVLGDDSGRIAIEMLDQNGNVVPIDLFGPNALALSLLMDGNQLCQKPLMPNSIGQIPSPSGSYAGDLNPQTAY